MADQVSGLLSNFLRSARQRISLRYIQGTVLDFGCGVGRLASWIPWDRYMGVDIDSESIAIARKANPAHSFMVMDDSCSGKKLGSFDCIFALAVLEHMVDKKAFFSWMESMLLPEGKIVITTPHPISATVHSIGSRCGLFSSSAEEEHESLINKSEIQRLLESSGLVMTHYKRFLFGMNQLFVISRARNNMMEKCKQ